MFAQRHIEFISFIVAVRLRFPQIPVDAAAAQGRPGHAISQRDIGFNHAYPLRAVFPNRILGQQGFIIIDFGREILQKLLQRRRKIIGDIAPDSAWSDIAAHHALSRKHLEHAQDSLALAESVKQDAHGSHIDGMSPQPDQMTSAARQFQADDADDLAAFWHIQVEQFFDGAGEGHIVGHGRKIIHAVGERHSFFVAFVLDGFFDAGMQKANIGQTGDDLFAVQFQQQAQYSMRAGMMRAHIKQHGFAGDRPFRDQPLQLFQAAFPFALLFNGRRCLRLRCYGHSHLKI